MDTKLSEEDLSRRWPGVEHAYAFVLPSYQWMLTRFEAADSRIQTLLAFIATVTLAIPAVVKATGQDASDSRLLIAAVAAGVAAISLGVIGRNIGRVMLASPSILWSQRWAQRGEWAFKMRMLNYAGAHFEKNARIIRTKGRFSLAMSTLFLGEVALSLVWLYLSRG